MRIVTSSLFWLLISAQIAGADDFAGPVISIIIDDIGYRFREDTRALTIPGPLAYAIMPHSPHARKMSDLASENGKDVLLHLPMEAMEKNKNHLLGPGALTLNMTKKEFISTLESNLHSVPNVIGVNNHMGSLLTKHAGRMRWLMKSLHEQGIFYLDSVTSRQSIVHLVAKETNVPYIRRDIFLDNTQDMKYIQAQFLELINTAIKKGYAIGIGHPYPETIEVLSDNLDQLHQYNVRLIGLKKLVARYQNNNTVKVSLLEPPELQGSTTNGNKQ